MKQNNKQIRVRVNWRPIVGEPSSAWRRLAEKLFKKRGKPAGTRQDGGDGGCKES